MFKLKIDGEVIEFKDWQEVHDDYVSRTNCNCRELEHWECAENELTDNHKWEEIERGPDAHDIATGDPQMTPDDITAHSEGLDCGMEDCEKCECFRSAVMSERLDEVMDRLTRAKNDLFEAIDKMKEDRKS